MTTNPVIEARPAGECDTCGVFEDTLIVIGHRLDGPTGPIYYSAPTCSVECHDSFYETTTLVARAHR